MKILFVLASLAASAAIAVLAPGPRSFASIRWTVYRFLTFFSLFLVVLFRPEPFLVLLVAAIIAAIHGIENPRYLCHPEVVWVESESGMSASVELDGYEIGKHIKTILVAKSESSLFLSGTCVTPSGESVKINSVTHDVMTLLFPPGINRLLFLLLSEHIESAKNLHGFSRHMLVSIFGEEYEQAIKAACPGMWSKIESARYSKLTFGEKIASAFKRMTGREYTAPTDTNVFGRTKDAAAKDQTV